MREIKFRAWNELKEKMSFWTLNDLLINFGYTELEEKPSVLNDEFMQYTGLKDKNGKEIYEGDIVRSYEKVATIIWLESEGGFYARTLTGECFKYAHNSIIEIIGNIYENQELLSGN